MPDPEHGRLPPLDLAYNLLSLRHRGHLYGVSALRLLPLEDGGRLAHSAGCNFSMARLSVP